jgi:hypothetical protein
MVKRNYPGDGICPRLGMERPAAASASLQGFGGPTSKRVEQFFAGGGQIRHGAEKVDVVFVQAEKFIPELQGDYIVADGVTSLLPMSDVLDPAKAIRLAATIPGDLSLQP